MRAGAAGRGGAVGAPVGAADRARAGALAGAAPRCRPARARPTRLGGGDRGRAGARRLVDAAVAVAPALRGGPDRRPGAGRHAGGPGVPGRCGDRGDAGHRAGAGGVRPAAGHPRSAGAAGTGAALGAPAQPATAASRWCRWTRSPSGTCWSSARATCVPGRRAGRGGAGGARRVGADRRAAAGASAPPASRCAAAWSTPGAAFELRGHAPRPAQSTYAGIVAAGRQAAAHEAAGGPARRPVRRLVPAASPWRWPGWRWLVTGRLVRAVAVLVVATPCPLLLAAPIAIVSGLSRARPARGGRPRRRRAGELLGRARTLLLDKTGTLTAGRPAVTEVSPPPGGAGDEVLRLAASVDQLSPHVLAEAAGRRRPASAGWRCRCPTDVTEEPGRASRGTVDGRQVAGRPAATRAGAAVGARARQPGRLDGALVVWVERRRRPGRRRPAAGPAAPRRPPDRCAGCARPASSGW